MRIEKLENGYKLTDLYITAAILCEPEMELGDVESVDSHRKVDGKSKKQSVFTVIGDPSKIKQVIDNFFNGKHFVDANNFKNKLQILKSRIITNF